MTLNDLVEELYDLARAGYGDFEVIVADSPVQSTEIDENESIIEIF